MLVHYTPIIITLSTYLVVNLIFIDLHTRNTILLRDIKFKMYFDIQKTKKSRVN